MTKAAHFLHLPIAFDTLSTAPDQLTSPSKTVKRPSQH